MNKTILTLFASVFLVISGCTGNLTKYNLDIFLCKLPDDNKLTDQMNQLMLPVKHTNNNVFLPEGNIITTKGKLSYQKPSTFLDKLRGGITKSSSFLILKQKTKDYLNGLSLESIGIKEQVTINDINSRLNNYDVILGYTADNEALNSQYAFRVFTNLELMANYITDSIISKKPDYKIVIIYNPPKFYMPSHTVSSGSLPEFEPLRQELLKIIDTKKSKHEREVIAEKVWDEYFYPDIFIQNLTDSKDAHPEIWNPGNGKSYLAHLVTLPSIIDISILSIEKDKGSGKISRLKLHEIRNGSSLINQ